MTNTGSSCENIYYNNPETGDKSGYYRINEKWTYCNMKELTSTKTTTLLTISPTATITATSLPIVSPTLAAGDFIPMCAGVGRGWKSIVNINISAGDDCPSGWHMDTHSGISFCRVVDDSSNTCSSASFSTNGTSYQRVCGRARGYQKGHTPCFWAYHNRGQTIDGYYADGLLITYDSPRQHIWSYTVGLYNHLFDTHANCPCAEGPASPPFVGHQLLL